MEDNSKHQEGVGSYSIMEDLGVVLIQIEVWEYNNTRRTIRTTMSCGQGGGIPPGCMIIIQPGWGVSIKLYNTTQEYSQEYSIMLYRRDLDRSMSAVYRVMCRLLQLHINPFIPGYDSITWISTYG